MSEQDGPEQHYGVEIKRYDPSQVRPEIAKYIEEISQEGNFEKFITPFDKAFFDWRHRAFSVLGEGARQLIENKLPPESWNAYFDQNLPATVLTKDLFRDFSIPMLGRFSQFSNIAEAERKAIFAFLIDFFDLVIHYSETDSYDYHSMYEGAGFPLKCRCHDGAWGYNRTFDDWFADGLNGENEGY